MKTFYYGINEVQLDILINTGYLRIPSNYLKSVNLSILNTSFNQALSQSTQNVYLNKVNKIVILELGFKTDVSEYFYLRREKVIYLKDVLGYYISEEISKDCIYGLEAGVELAIDYSSLLGSIDKTELTTSNKESIYNKINLDGIEFIDINDILNLNNLNSYIDKTFKYMNDINKFAYRKIS